MALIKHRPKLGLRAPTVIMPGVQVGGTVIVDAARDVPIEAITVQLHGEERVTIGSGKNQSVYRHDVLRLRADLEGPKTLEAGRHELPFTFVMPEDAPATYGYGHVTVQYTAEVRVDIDWWPDAVSRFTLTVGRPPRALAEPQPRIYSTAPDGPVAGRLALEASLASEVIPLDGTIHMAVGVTGSAAARLREVRIALSAIETRYNHVGRSHGAMTVQRYLIKVPPQTAEAGAPVRMKVPDVPPSTRSKLFRLDWALDVEGVVAFGSNIEMRLPIQLVPAGGVRSRSDLAPAPVGSPRQRAIWEEVARAAGLRFDGESMRAEIGDTKLALYLSHRAAGVVLVGELRYPSLHIDLDGGRKGGFHRLLRGAGDVLVERFGDDHYVTGRDAAQVRAFVEALEAAVFDVTLDDIDDEMLVFVARQRTRDAVEEMVRRLTTLARQLPTARAAIPAPRDLAEHRGAWEALAEREGASLERARMALHFRRGEDRAAIVTEWNGEGEAYRTTAGLWVRDPIDEDYHFLSTEGALRDDEAKRYGADARQLLGRLVEETPHVRVEAGALVAHLEPQLEPAHAFAIMKRLEALSALLRGAAGPYR